MNGRKKVKPATGQVVAIPLADGTVGLGHVALYKLSMTIVLFAHRAPSPEDLGAVLEAIREPPIAVLEVTSDEVEDGEWPVIGTSEPCYPAPLLDTKGTSYGATFARSLLSAYHGLRPWDDLHDPKYYEKRLLPGVEVPATVRYKKDVATVSTSPAPRQQPRITEQPPITAGPAEVHIQIMYTGDGLPGVELLRRRQDLESRLEAAGAGEVTDAGAGDGVMDIYLATDDVRQAMPLIEKMVADVGFAADASIEIGALDDPN